jgi:hypothetical protein
LLGNLLLQGMFVFVVERKQTGAVAVNIANTIANISANVADARGATGL